MSIVKNSMEQLPVAALNVQSTLSEFTLQFDSHWTAAAGAVAGAGIIGYGLVKGRRTAEQADAELALYPDPDMYEDAARQFRSDSRWTKAAGAALGLAAGGMLMNMAGPHNVETEYNAQKVAIIVDASADGRAEDVTDTKHDVQVARMQAGINSGIRFANDAGQEVQVDFIFAGNQAKALGEVKGSAGKKEMIAEATSYSNNLGTAGGADIAGALQLADAEKPDQTIVITTNADIATADAITAYQGPAEAKKHDVTVIVPGKAGTTYNFLGVDRTAGYTATFGTVEGQLAQNTDQMQDVMNNILNTKVVSTQETPSRFYEAMRNIGIAGLAVFGIRKYIVSGRKAKRA